MEHWVRVIYDKTEKFKQLSESVLPAHQLYETEQDGRVIHIPLQRELTAKESDEFASKLANYLFEQGLQDFDIEVSTSIIDEVTEETYDSDNDFYENYGVMWYNEDRLDEAEYQGRKVELGKPTQGDVKKFKVYVKNPQGNVVKVNFGEKGAKIKKSNPKRRKSFRARHNCSNPGPRHKARYWSCRKW